jgi:very-short-patch-repair endonuclease
MKWKKLHDAPTMTGKRRELRNNCTPEEAILWERIRKRQIDGLIFKRQHSVGGYILDFYCGSKRLAIEIDGMHHLNKDIKRYDDIRTEFLNSHNIKVIRFMNSQINNDLQSVLNEIMDNL